MAVRVECHAEPIPGYRLIERLGGGGFGEVWKAEAPGGLFKAIKFVFGDLAASGADDDSRADQEFKALKRVTTVHHPYILSLERYDVVDGQLIIVMELADRTLWDRFRECRSQGLPGLPRAELLGYMSETAEALDLMNNHYQLQHLDIKPQNLFLVFNHVKVADFGLVKDLEGRAATVTGGVTPVYAAPETFDGWLSRFSDQYSLAIVYQELLTGQRPFAGTTIRQLVLQHLQASPDLSSLMGAERPVIGRALSKNPDHRFPTCLEFVQALRDAVSVGSGMPASIPTTPALTKDVPTTALENRLVSPESQGQASIKMEETRNERGPFAKPGHAGDQLPDDISLPLAPLPQRPPKGVPKVPSPVGETPGPGVALTPFAQQLSKVEVSPDGVLRPALVMGLGQLGLGILKQLRKELNEQYGHLEGLPHLRLMYLDTDADAVQAATQSRVEGLHASEVLLARLHRPSYYLRAREGKLPYESWLNSKVLYRIPRQRNHSCVRALGRLAFVDNQRMIARRLEAALATCCAPETLQWSAQQTGLKARTTVPRVYIVTGLGGGTGSGMFLDLAYVIRHLLREQGYDNAELVGLFLLPHAGPDSARGAALANAVAALTELNHFSSPDAVFSARYDARDPQPSAAPFQEKGPPFQQCLMVPLPETRAGSGQADLNEALVKTGHYLYCDLLTRLGGSADDLRRQLAQDRPVPETAAPGYHTVGAYRIFWPRRQVLQQAAQRLSSRLVQHWMSKESRRFQGEIESWALQQWEAQGFRPENLIARHQEKCEQILKQAPEKMCSGVINPLADLLAAPGSRKSADPSLKIAPVVQAVDYLEKLLGVPDEIRAQAAQGMSEVEYGVIENALRDAGEAIAADCEQKMAEMVVRLFEEPAFRLAGAEEAVRQFSACVQKALESQEGLVRELHERTIAINQRIHALLDNEAPISPTATTARWKAPFSRRTPQSHAISGTDFLELLRSYAKCRYQSLVLQTINSLYVRLRGNLSDQMREIGFCRHRLQELVDMVRERSSPLDVDSRSPRANQVLLPGSCTNLDEFVRQIEKVWTNEDVLAFDQQIQELINKQFRALVHVCMAASNVVRALAPALVQEAETFLQPRLEGANVAEMFLARYADDDAGRSALENDLHAAHDEAAPELATRSAAKEACIICVPAGAAGDRFRTHAQRLFPEAKVVESDRADEILIVRGFQPFDLGELEQLGPLGLEAYHQRFAQDSASLHSRIDVNDWRPATLVNHQ